MARSALSWIPARPKASVTATGQSLIDLGLLERASRR